MDGVPDVAPAALAAPVAIRPYVLDTNVVGITWELYDPDDHLVDGFSTVAGGADATAVPYMLEAARFGTPGTVKSGRYLLRLMCRGSDNHPVAYAERSFQVTGDAEVPEAGPGDEHEKGSAPTDAGAWEREEVGEMQRYGERPPGYESPKSAYTLDDLNSLTALLKERDKASKENAADFLGDYGETMIKIWTAHATDLMVAEAEKSEFSVLGEIFQFMIIKTIETLAASYGGPVVVWAFETFGKKLKHIVAEKGVEWTTAAGAELVSASLKAGDIDNKKEEIDQVAERLGAGLKLLSQQTIMGLPDTGPFYQWLGWVRGSPANYRRLADFRLPALFPSVSGQQVRTAVAANIVADLGAQGVVPVTDKEPEYNVWGHRKTSSIEEGVIRAHVFADGFRPVRVYSAFDASADLMKELAGRPVSEMPMVPVRVHIHGSSSTGPMYAPKWLQDAFVRLFPEPEAAAVTRDQAGLVRVTDFGLPELVALYEQAHPGDGSKDALQLLIDEATDRAVGLGPVSPDDIALYVQARLLSERQLGANALMGLVAESKLDDTPSDKWERIAVRHGSVQ
jgi:hypothetical protein